MAQNGEEQVRSNALGARLARARERLGWSHAEAAEKLHLDPQVLIALEAERFDALGAPVYVRGHLRSYAALVGESVSDIESLYQLKQDRLHEPDLRQSPTAIERALVLPPRIPPRVLWWLVAALSVIAVLVWTLRRGGVGDTGREGSSAIVAQAPQPESAAAPAELAGKAGRGGVQPHEEKRAAGEPAGPASGAKPVAAEEPAPAPPPPAPPPRRTSLSLHFGQAVAVSVTDATGNSLLAGVMEAGAAPTLRGRAPFTLSFSNPSAVGLVVDERTVFLTAAMRDTPNLQVRLDANGRLTQLR